MGKEGPHLHVGRGEHGRVKGREWKPSFADQNYTCHRCSKRKEMANRFLRLCN